MNTEITPAETIFTPEGISYSWTSEEARKAFIQDLISPEDVEM